MALSRKNISETIIISPQCREQFLTLETSDADVLRERGVMAAGVSDLKPPFLVGRVDPKFHVVLLTTAGRAHYRTLEAEGEIKESSLWIGPAHAAYEYEAMEWWQVSWFHLAEWVLPEGLQADIYPDLPARSITAAMEGYVSEGVRHETGIGTAARAYADVIGVLLDRVMNQIGHPRRLSHRLAPLWDEVNADLAGNWTVERLAGLLCVSPPHLYRISRQQHGVSPMGMVTNLRMRRAAAMLKGTNYTVDLISSAVGYQTSFAFSRAFKRHTGLSPMAYRLS